MSAPRIRVVRNMFVSTKSVIDVHVHVCFGLLQHVALCFPTHDAGAKQRAARPVARLRRRTSSGTRKSSKRNTANVARTTRLRQCSRHATGYETRFQTHSRCSCTDCALIISTKAGCIDSTLYSHPLLRLVEARCLGLLVWRMLDVFRNLTLLSWSLLTLTQE